MKANGETTNTDEVGSFFETLIVDVFKPFVSLYICIRSTNGQETSLREEIMNKLYMLVGIPGAGKSTWVKRNRSSEVLISPDLFLEDKYGYEWTPKRASEAWANAYQRFATCLQQEQSVVWDATFITSQDRAAPLNIAKAFGYHVVAVFLDTPLQVCLSRNAKRKRLPVPRDKIEMMRRRLRPPTTEEGFDEVVRIGHSVGS